jgi:UDP-N-acetylmuramyl pentapeptide phosphotransferase/UDP-N-acetylglucosamine-1-phosphate transferase
VVLGLVPILVAITVSSAVIRDSRWAWHALVVTAALSLLGALDDARPVSPATKLLVQIPIAAFATRVLPLPLDLGGEGGNIAARCFQIFFMVVVFNAVNVIDVADGLAPSVSAISLGASSAVLAALGDQDAALVGIAFAGATVGFLGFNSAGVAVLGDTASLPLGGLLAMIAPLAAHSSERSGLLVLLFLILPIGEVVWLSLQRSRRGIRPWHASPHHLAFQLVAWGLTPAATVLLLVFVQAAGVALALWFSGPTFDGTLLATVAVGVAFASSFALVRRLRPIRAP